MSEGGAGIKILSEMVVPLEMGAPQKNPPASEHTQTKRESDDGAGRFDSQRGETAWCRVCYARNAVTDNPVRGAGSDRSQSWDYRVRALETAKGNAAYLRI